MKTFLLVTALVGCCAYLTTNVVRLVRKIIANKKRKEQIKEMEKQEDEISKQSQDRE